MQITEQTLKPIAQVGTDTLKRFLAPLQECFTKYEINTPSRQMCFLAQVGHESGGLFYTEELASGRAYEGRKDLGNTKAGDGVKYKGRGILQITGRANYASLSKDLGEDFIIHPEKLGGKNSKVCTDEQLRNAVMSAGWFWNKNKLNAYADKVNPAWRIEDEPNLQAFKDLTRRINGGYNGLQDRISKFRLLQKSLEIMTLQFIDVFEITGRGTVYTMSCEANGLSRATGLSKELLGTEVMIDGKNWIVAGIESMGGMSGQIKDLIGLLVRKPNT